MKNDKGEADIQIIEPAIIDFQEVLDKYFGEGKFSIEITDDNDIEIGEVGKEKYKVFYVDKKLKNRRDVGYWTWVGPQDKIGYWELYCTPVKDSVPRTAINEIIGLFFILKVGVELYDKSITRTLGRAQIGK